MEWGIVAAVAGIITSIGALIWQVRSLRIGLNEASYTELDKLYFDLVRIRVERPELAFGPGNWKRSSPTSPGALARDNYAFMVWNFIETVIDRCDGRPHLLSAWAPAVEHESRSYADWLQDERLLRYRPDFKQRIRRVVQFAQQARAKSGPEAPE